MGSEMCIRDRSEDGLTLDVFRNPCVRREDIPLAAEALSRGQWMAEVLEEVEGGYLHERYRRVA